MVNLYGKKILNVITATLACFNFCPEQSILVKNYTHKDGRYYHPDVTAQDIAEQKRL